MEDTGFQSQYFKKVLIICLYLISPFDLKLKGPMKKLVKVCSYLSSELTFATSSLLDHCDEL